MQNMVNYDVIIIIIIIIIIYGDMMMITYYRYNIITHRVSCLMFR